MRDALLLTTYADPHALHWMPCSVAQSFALTLGEAAQVGPSSMRRTAAGLEDCSHETLLPPSSLRQPLAPSSASQLPVPCPAIYTRWASMICSQYR